MKKWKILSILLAGAMLCGCAVNGDPEKSGGDIQGAESMESQESDVPEAAAISGAERRFHQRGSPGRTLRQTFSVPAGGLGL